VTGPSRWSLGATIQRSVQIVPALILLLGRPEVRVQVVIKSLMELNSTTKAIFITSNFVSLSSILAAADRVNALASKIRGVMTPLPKQWTGGELALHNFGAAEESLLSLSQLEAVRYLLLNPFPELELLRPHPLSLNFFLSPGGLAPC
jgi:hypothetical protein